jgi:Holliday junction DNA helicase RuvA
VIYSIEGKVAVKASNYAVLEAGGIGLKIFVNHRTGSNLPAEGESSKLFCHLHSTENDLTLYGFCLPDELDFFELLISVSGVGPKSALSILDIADLKELSAAIKEGRPDLLTRASGIGRKTAERIIIELKNKVVAKESEKTVRKMESDTDLAETLVSLGFRRDEARAGLSKIGEDVVGIENRLKAALKILNKNKNS